MDDAFRDALILTGPTASGKTEIALRLAERLDAEIVSMDSMALYRGLDILSAKPTPAERAAVPHHLVDVLDPWESSGVKWWLDRAIRCAEEIRARGRTVLVVGGTPLYLKALLHGLFEGPGADADLRLRLEEQSRRVGSAVLHERLALVDPTTAARLHVNDVRRIVRALEVWELTGRPLSAWQTQWDSPTPTDSPRCFRIDRPREELYARIDARVLDMVARGLVEEVDALRRLPRPVGRQATQAAGWNEVCRYLDGAIDRDEMIRSIQTRSRNLAKRQMTWFRSISGCVPTDERLTDLLRGPRMEVREPTPMPSPPFC